MFMQAAGQEPGTLARIISPIFPERFSSSEKCMSVSVSMYGRHFGGFNVLNQYGRALFQHGPSMKAILPVINRTKY